MSPFAVIAAPDVGDIFVAFGPSVDFPDESVMPDCVWFFVTLAESPLIAPPVEPLLMFEPLIFVVSMLDPLDIEPPALSVVGATVVVVDVVVEVESVAMLLSLLLHAAIATRAATIAMRFMNPPSEK